MASHTLILEKQSQRTHEQDFNAHSQDRMHVDGALASATSRASAALKMQPKAGPSLIAEGAPSAQRWDERDLTAKGQHLGTTSCHQGNQETIWRLEELADTITAYEPHELN